MAERQKPLLFRMIDVQKDGTRVPKTVRADSVRHQEAPFHQFLTRQQKDRATSVWNRIGKIARPGGSLNKWLDGFRYDLHPDREIRTWEKIAGTFERMYNPKMTTEQRTLLVRTILLISMQAVDVESQTGLPEEIVTRLRAAYAYQETLMGDK